MSPAHLRSENRHWDLGFGAVCVRSGRGVQHRGESGPPLQVALFRRPHAVPIEDAVGMQPLVVAAVGSNPDAVPERHTAEQHLVSHPICVALAKIVREVEPETVKGTGFRGESADRVELGCIPLDPFRCAYVS